MNFEQGIFGQMLVLAGAAALLAGCGDDGTAGTEATVIPDTETTAGSSGSTAGSTGATTETTTTGTPTTGETSSTGDGSSTTTGPIEPPAYDKWLTIPLEGAVCGNNSQYKIFVNFHEGAKDLLVMLEPGGACWDFDTCSGNSPLGAAHPDGVPDDLMMDQITSVLSPLIRRDVEGPTKDWNMVFIPYCTGDVHTGNNVITYKDPNGVQPDLEFHHNGHNNIMAATSWMGNQFPDLDRLFITGCSAGGAGSLINYYFFRQGINAKRNYLMDDSGPIFPSGGHSGPLHTMIRASWDIDSVLTELPPEYAVTDDFGVINTYLSEMFPEDRLSTVYYQRDYNYSRYSYERFYPNMTKDKVHEFWADDTDLLVDLYDPLPNFAYYLPYWRELNDSHCVSIISYLDTEIEEQNMDLGKFIDDLLDDGKPLQSYRESVQPNEDN